MLTGQGHPNLTAAKEGLPSDQRIVARLLAFSRDGENRLGSLYDILHDIAGAQVALGDFSEALCAGLKLQTEAAVAIFRLASRASGPVEVELGPGAPVSLPATGISGYADAGLLWEGILLSSIRRDRESLSILTSIPSYIVRASDTQSQEAVYLLIDAWQLYWSGNPQVGAVLTESGRATVPSRVRQGAEDWINMILRPHIASFSCLLNKDPGGFNAWLQRGVELHEQYWDRERNRNRPEGFFSLPLTGVSAVAYDMGFPIRVESRYLPKFLVEGGCRCQSRGPAEAHGGEQPAGEHAGDKPKTTGNGKAEGAGTGTIGTGAQPPNGTSGAASSHSLTQKPGASLGTQVTGVPNENADQEQLELIRKTLAPANGELQWKSRRNFLKCRIDSILFDSIPKEYSPGTVARLMPHLTALHRPDLANSFPEEQRELVRKTMSPATGELQWISRRRFLLDRIDPSLFDRIPEQYSPKAMDQLLTWIGHRRKP